MFGGVQNLTDERPFATQPSFPTGTRGRYFFAGITASLQGLALRPGAGMP